MKELHDRKILNLSDKYKDYIEMKEKQGLFDFSEIMMMIENTPVDELTDLEKDLKSDVDDIWQHQEDTLKMVNLNKIRIFRAQRTYGMPF